MEKTDNCPICLETICENNMCRTNCGHTFHLTCILCVKTEKCPICRRNYAINITQLQKIPDNIANMTNDEIYKNIINMVDDCVLYYDVNDIDSYGGYILGTIELEYVNAHFNIQWDVTKYWDDGNIIQSLTYMFIIAYHDIARRFGMDSTDYNLTPNFFEYYNDHLNLLEEIKRIIFGESPTYEKNLKIRSIFKQYKLYTPSNVRLNIMPWYYVQSQSTYDPIMPKLLKAIYVTLR